MGFGQKSVLDNLSVTPVIAFSVRKMTVNYTGKCINVRRSSDNTTMDIGFIGSQLDTTTLLNFVGTGNGYVTTWYNQGTYGSSCNVTQNNTSNQPQIVSSGVVLTCYGVPALQFLATNNCALSNSAGYAMYNAGAFTLNLVQNTISVPTSTYPAFVTNNYNGFGGLGIGPAPVSPYTLEIWENAQGNSGFSSVSNLQLNASSIISITSALGLSGGSLTATAYQNSVSAGSTTLNSIGSQGPGFVIGTFGGSSLNPINGYLQEITVFTSVLSTQDRLTLEGSQTNFYLNKLVLDQLTSGLPTVAYSLRQLTSTYSGPAITVIRSSDNTTSNISFSNGTLNTSALLSFVGNANAYVTTWYNQGSLGGSANLIQTVTSAQPQIVINGSIVTFGGEPSLLFSGAQDLYSTGTPQVVATTGVWTVNAVTGTTSSTSVPIIAADPSGAAGSRIFSLRLSTGGLYALAFNSAGNLFSTGSTLSTPQTVVTAIQNNTTLASFTNGRTDATSTTGTMYGGAVTLRIGLDGAASLYYTGYISETTVFASALSTADRTTLENSQINFYPQLVLDQLASGLPPVAYSLRLLTNTYAGPAINVVRSSDNTTSNISFSNGTLNTSALLSFVGNANAYVTTWYNQGTLGAAGNAVQATIANQPQIVINGVVKTWNGFPAVYFGGSNVLTSISGNVQVVNPTTGTITVGVVANTISTAQQDIFVQDNGTRVFTMRTQGSNTNTPYFQIFNTGATGTTAGSSTYPYNIYGGTFDGTNVKVFGNGINTGITTFSGNLETGTQHVSIGATPSNTLSFIGSISEATAFPAALSTSDLTTLFGNQQSYYLTNILDALSVGVPVIAYSLRQLTKTYTGPAITVQRSSDNATLNIGFVNGQLDTTTLLAFVGTGTGYVTTWYNQGTLGSIANVVNTTTASQPQIAVSGSINSTGGRPSLLFSTSSATILYTVSTAVQVTTTGAWSGNMVTYSNLSGANGYNTPLSVNLLNGSVSAEFYFRQLVSGGAGRIAAFNSSGNTGTIASSSSALPTTQMIWSATQNNTTLASFVNGSSYASTGVTAPLSTVPTSILLGNGGAGIGYNYNGTISEVILCGTALSTTDRQILEHNQEYYFSITGV